MTPGIKRIAVLSRSETDRQSTPRDDEASSPPAAPLSDAREPCRPAKSIFRRLLSKSHSRKIVPLPPIVEEAPGSPQGSLESPTAILSRSFTGDPEKAPLERKAACIFTLKWQEGQIVAADRIIETESVIQYHPKSDIEPE